ncbi:uncharacterized protein FIBRA_07691 [Fibroporia radiculosa]|uniref:Major facilitator superfamily (MFS) profile domain-containing protein n=1 Tax=Fibroporia radiculosa TaxID=599839 RepID=J4GVG1_9APHY|nr:uncharacterized protein FIBRA_07691 [Fibroporia radiculosa]CCM05470.1 predicted protein [Fibroporia radiculosa]
MATQDVSTGNAVREAHDYLEKTPLDSDRAVFSEDALHSSRVSTRGGDLDLNQPPDGGLHAWMSIVAVWLLSFITFGIGSVWGIFQDAYVRDPSSSFRDTSVFKLGFVGGCATGFAFIAGPFSNILVSKFGIHTPILIGVIFTAVSFELASISKRYWELLLSQGILLGASLAFIPSASLPSQWFYNKRSLATAIGSSGSGIGAVILSPVVQAIINHSSIAWALRFLGFLSFVFGLGGVVMIRQRLVAKKKVQYKVFDFSILKVPGYPLYLAYAFLQFFGYVTPLFFIPSYCTTIGLTASQASGVLSIATASNAIGRVVAGIIGDIAGSINVLICFNALSGFMCIFVWFFARSFGDMIAFGILWGFFCGGMEKLGSAVAIQFLMNVIPPIFAVPIGSRIIASTASSSRFAENPRAAYRYLIIWCFLASIVASILLIPVRMGFSKRILAKV